MERTEWRNEEVQSRHRSPVIRAELVYCMECGLRVFSRCLQIFSISLVVKIVVVESYLVFAVMLMYHKPDISVRKGFHCINELESQHKGLLRILFSRALCNCLLHFLHHLLLQCLLLRFWCCGKFPDTLLKDFCLLFSYIW